MQNKLYKILSKDFYSSKELSVILNASINIIKRITKNLKQYKEGFKKDDIIRSIMGGTLYNEEMIENIKIQKLFKDMY